MQNSTLTKQAFRYSVLLVALLSGAAAQTVAPATNKISVASGTASFKSGTNGGITVAGTSKKLSASAAITRTGDQLQITGISASIPAHSFESGIKMRDEHTVKYIFTKADGSVPDIAFTAPESTCPLTGTCKLAGNLSVRGNTAPFVLNLSIKSQGADYSVTADGTVLLSALQIPRPKELIVQSNDNVDIRLSFTAKGGK